MKRIVIALLLMLGIAGACVGEHYVLHRQGNKIQSLVQQAAEDYQNGRQQQAITTVAQLAELWHTAERQLSFFVGHDDIRELELSITRLEPLCRDGNSDVFLSECALVEMLMRHIAENQKLRLENIL